MPAKGTTVKNPKTHCKRHHAFSVLNVYFHNGKRICKPCRKLWDKQNTRKRKEISKRWYEKHTVVANQRGIKWRQENPDAVRAIKSRRRTTATQAGGSFTPQEWKVLCRRHCNKCLCCKRHRKLTADHVIPVSRGGTSSIGNIQPLCGPCNSSKGTKTIDYRT